MNAATIVLGLGVVASGLCSGLLLAVLALLQPILKELAGPEFALVMRHFLPAGRRSPVNFVLMLTPVIAGSAALLLGVGPIAGARFILTLAGTVVFLASPLLVSTFASEPLYTAIMGWSQTAPPPDWHDARERYFRINWLRLTGALVGFLLLLAALALPAA